MILIVRFFESTSVELFLFVDEEDLVLFTGQSLRQLDDSILGLAQSNKFVNTAHLWGHRSEIL